MKLISIREAKVIIIIIILIKILIFLYSMQSTFWKNTTTSIFSNGIEPQRETKQTNDEHGKGKDAKDKTKNANKHIRKSITIVFRNFYTFENDLKASIDSILDIIPNIPIVVLQEGIPYPPLIYERNVSVNAAQDDTIAGSSVRFVNLAFDIEKLSKELNPLTSIHTKYVLFMPDSVRLTSKNILQKILREINHATNKQKESIEKAEKATDDSIVRHMVIVPFAGNMKSFSSCTQIKFDLPNWTIFYKAVNETEQCDLYLQKHALLLDAGILKEIPEPFASPFPEMLYMQIKMLSMRKRIFSLNFQDGHRLFAAYHTKQHRMDIRRRQFKEMYRKLQIKRIVRHSYKILAKTDTKDGPMNNALNFDGDAMTNHNHNNNNNQHQHQHQHQHHHHNLVLDTQQFSSSNFSLPQVTEIDLIGCERATKSCVGTVYNDRPFYLYVGKHTPPCCLDKLRTTISHVLEEFENVGIRYWLDNYALKAAIETNDLSPDAYDIDLSFNIDDLERSNSMKKSQNKPFTDNIGFYWIKATDGHYFRVQFSKINQIGVNLLPYETIGNKVSPSGFFGWKAKEFSLDYLHPMSTVLFLGKHVTCPNNVLEYLDYKNIK